MQASYFGGPLYTCELKQTDTNESKLNPSWNDLYSVISQN